MIKLLFSDFDGTLLCNTDKSLEINFSESNLRALNKLKRNNIDICLATGRDNNQVENILEILGFSQSPYIASNGAAIHYRNITELRTIPVERSKKLIETFYEFTDPKHVRFMAVSDKGTYIADYDDEQFNTIIINRKRKREEYDLKTFISTRGNIQLQKIIFYVVKEENFMQFKNDFVDRFGDYFDIWSPNPTTLEVTHKGVNKGAAIYWLLRNSSISIDEIAVIGDGLNDVPMLKQTKYSFAINKSEEEVRKCSKYIIDSFEECVDIIVDINKKDFS